MVRLIIHGRVNAMMFRTETLLPINRPFDYTQSLDVFYASLSLGIEAIFSGKA